MHLVDNDVIAVSLIASHSFSDSDSCRLDSFGFITDRCEAGQLFFVFIIMDFQSIKHSARHGFVRPFIRNSGIFMCSSFVVGT